MRWYFVIATIVAVLISIVYGSGDPQAWTVTLVVAMSAIGIFLILSAACFFATFLAGSFRENLFVDQQKTESPFAHETMPPQIVPPQVRD